MMKEVIFVETYLSLLVQAILMFGVPAICWLIFKPSTNGKEETSRYEKYKKMFEEMKKG